MCQVVSGGYDAVRCLLKKKDAEGRCVPKMMGGPKRPSHSVQEWMLWPSHSVQERMLWPSHSVQESML